MLIALGALLLLADRVKQAEKNVHFHFNCFQKQTATLEASLKSEKILTEKLASKEELQNVADAFVEQRIKNLHEENVKKVDTCKYDEVMENLLKSRAMCKKKNDDMQNLTLQISLLTNEVKQLTLERESRDAILMELETRSNGEKEKSDRANCENEKLRRLLIMVEKRVQDQKDELAWTKERLNAADKDLKYITGKREAEAKNEIQTRAGQENVVKKLLWELDSEKKNATKNASTKVEVEKEVVELKSRLQIQQQESIEFQSEIEKLHNNSIEQFQKAQTLENQKVDLQRRVQVLNTLLTESLHKRQMLIQSGVRQYSHCKNIEHNLHQLDLEKEIAQMGAKAAFRVGAQANKPQAAPTTEDLLIQKLLLKQRIVKGEVQDVLDRVAGQPSVLTSDSSSKADSSQSTLDAVN